MTNAQDKTKAITRRRFLGRTAAGAAAAVAFPDIIPSSALGLAGAVAPSNRVALGCIGVGSRGGYLLGAFLELEDVNVVGVCDVKSDRREWAKAQVDQRNEDTACEMYLDFQEIVQRDDIDAFVIASTDHWHVLLALAAVRAGKDVYVEKPLGLSLEQDVALRTAVRQHGAIFQFGTQQRSTRDFRLACELVRNGRIGELKEVNVWAPPSESGGPLNVAPVPDYLDYDRWLGPAPEVPYTFERDSNKWWWFNSDYAIGFIAGWGIHPIDIALWGGGAALETPVTIEGTGAFSKEGICNTATSWDLTCAYDAGVTMHFRSAPAPDEWKARYSAETDHGTAFEGTEGWVHVDRRRVKAHEESLLATEFGPDEPRLYVSDHHARNFIDCVKSRKDPISPIEAAVSGDMLCQVSDIALRLERKVTWDPVAERFRDDPEADRFLTRAMRSPWHL